MRSVIVILLCFLFVSCRETAITPRPRGLIRIDLPQVKYQIFTSEELPYSFSVSSIATVELPLLNQTGNWINVSYESLDAKIYCTYHQIEKKDLAEFEEEGRRLLERSVKRANLINEQFYENPEVNVYGTLFTIEGDAPSPIQFMLTDSLHHYFRGALYYQKNTSNYDSIAPVTEYIHQDIIELIQSFRWK